MKALPDPHARPHALAMYRTPDRHNENVPYSTDAEQGVLASILIDQELWDKVIQYLDDKCFYINAHRFIFKAMELLKTENHDIDVVTVSNKLKELGQYDNSGGAVYLTSCINSIQNSRSIASFVRIVFEKWKARSIIQLSERLSVSCIDGSFSEIIVNEFVGAVEKVFTDKTGARPYSFSDNTSQVIDDIAEKAGQYQRGIPYTTSIPDLDKLTGGIEKKTLSVIGAKSSIGKTSFMTQMGFGLAKKLHRVLYFTTEMPEAEIRNRIISGQ
jgi:replicative DNA helicase